ncbi:MAG: hypothetical protein GXP25_23815 [Planctomycetes bacterium]|nr:hypothetical protein [Planctomycetota bacterium]
MKELAVFALGLIGLLSCAGCREPIVRTYAYSHSIQNYDPNLVSIQIEPAEASLPAGGEQTLVATVLDKEGKPSPGQRVEWLVCRSPNGVGEIISVDESGLFLADRGAKFDNTNAITYTNQFDHSLKKAREGGVDFDTLLDKPGSHEIKKGQTWITISAAAAGETHIMVYAPGIGNQTKSKAFAVVRWTRAGEQ